MKNRPLFDPAERICNVPFSPVRKVMDRAKELEAQGNRMVYFQIGEPDFDTPKPIIEATIAALQRNKTHYAANRGPSELRKAITQTILDKTGLRYDPQTELLVVVGGAEALFTSFFGLVNPGDEVILFTPAFMNYAALVGMTGAVPVTIPLRKENNLQIDPAEVRARVTPKTRMMVINNPANPTGVVYEEKVLRELAEIAVQNDILVLSDEIYDEITYDGVSCRSIATFPGMRERAILMNGFSKAYAMTGWRLGYLAADERLILHCLKIHQYVTTCAPTFIQDGLANAMLLPETAKAKAAMVDAFARRRTILLDGLRKIPGFSFAEPKGAFYVLLDVSGTGLSGEAFAKRLLEEKHVAVVPGIGFGSDPEYVRLSFALSEDDIRLGLQRMDAFVRSLAR